MRALGKRDSSTTRSLKTVSKNIIYGSIEEYLKTYEILQDVVIDKIDGYKRKLIPGTEEYDIVFERLYEDELRKRGML